MKQQSDELDGLMKDIVTESQQLDIHILVALIKDRISNNSSYVRSFLVRISHSHFTLFVVARLSLSIILRHCNNNV